MNKKKLSIIAGIIIIIIGIVGSLLTYRFIKPEPIFEEKVINNSAISSIEIDSDNVGVNIYPTTDGTMKVTLEGETLTNIKSHLLLKLKIQHFSLIMMKNNLAGSISI